MEPGDHDRRLHLLQGVLRRWVGSPYLADLVLGGSLLTQHWVGHSRRTAKDLDFVGLYDTALGATLDRFRAILGADAHDGILYDTTRMRGESTWPESPFPGTRVDVPARLADLEIEVRIDVGFGFPLVPPVEALAYPCLDGSLLMVPSARPELMVAWKLDGLFERGLRRWLGKGVHDLYLLTEHVPLDRDLLREAIRVSFASHDISLDRIRRVVYHREFWEKEASRNKWAKFRATCAYAVPEDLLGVVQQVAHNLRPALAGLLDLPS